MGYKQQFNVEPYYREADSEYQPVPVQCNTTTSWRNAGHLPGETLINL